MSKADKERMKKEEQERKALEEEAAKLKALEDAKKQKKEMAALAVERAKHENEERRRRREDMTELQMILDSNDHALQDLNSCRRVQAKWSRYMRCDGSPDPKNQGEINTYINLKMEDKSRNDAISVLKDSLMDLSLIEELNFVLRDTPEAELSDHDRSLYHETISELEKLMDHKLDLATLQILCDATKLSNPETNNLEHVVSNNEISLCLWGNLTKNPRIKQFEFTEVNITFDIPKVLSLSDCAVRVLITKFDHLSQTSKASMPRRKKKEIIEPEVSETFETEKAEEGEAEEKEDEEKEDEEAEKEETDIDLMAALHGTEGEEEEKEEEDVVEQHEEMEEDFQDPSTPEPSEWEDFDEEDDIIDLRANDVLGGVYKINLLQMPPQPKTAGSWTITQLVDPPEIERLEYVPDPPAQEGEKDKNGKDKDAKKDEKPPITISMILPQDVLFLEEPQVAHWDYSRKFWTTKDIQDISYNEDTRSLSFKTNCFGTLCLLQDSHINMPFQSWEIRPHKLNSAVLSIIAAIVEIEIEIKDALCCLKSPSDKPELESIRNKWVTPSELIVMMKRAGVNVFPDEDSSKYVSIQNKEKDILGRKNKHPLIEERMYQQMALTASTMAYSWSKWNGETERYQVVLQAAESLEDEPLLEEDWWVILATKRRVTKLKMTEFDDTFNETPDGDGIAGSKNITSRSTSMSTLNRLAPKRGFSATRSVMSSASNRSSKVHKKKLTKLAKMRPIAEDINPFYTEFDHEHSLFKSNIYHLMKDVTSETAIERVKNTNYQFIDCVHQLLKATKVLTYA